MPTKKNKMEPSLKSASGAGFTFEDKAVAMLLCEMLVGIHSLGTAFGVIQKLERQAGDWEPFGDILLHVANSDGKLIRCGGSVKSNRPLNTNGCNSEFCAGIWEVMAKPVFEAASDFILLISAPLSPAVRDHLNNLCRQAGAIDAERLDQKVAHENVRKIYESFRKAGDSSAKGLPGNVLAKLIHLDADFEATVSQSEIKALKLCRDVLRPDEQNEEKAKDLWKRLCEVAQELRVSGGAVTCADITTKIRHKFGLRDDPSDIPAWTKIRQFTRDGIDEIVTCLPGNIRLPRRAENTSLLGAIIETRACHVLGGSGSGKSALIKEYAKAIEGTTGSEVVWIKAERFSVLNSAVPNLLEVLVRCRKTSALLIIDALEGCATPESFGALARLISAVSNIENSPWSVVCSCQTPEWARVCAALSKHMSGSSALTKRVECDLLSKEDFDVIKAASVTVSKLSHDAKLRGFLSTPKMLDVLLSGQLAENRAIAGEADLVEWWWEQQIRGHRAISAEERVARELASRMADELRSELPPDSVAGSEEAANKLIQNRVLTRTQDGRLRFEHDLLADWARVMFLKGLAQEKLAFIKAHTENPPWLRSVRLLSQHLLDRIADLSKWRDFLNSSKVIIPPHDEPSAENLQIVDAWLEGIFFSLNPARVLTEVSTDLFDNSGWLLRRLIRRLILVGTVPDPVIQEQCTKIRLNDVEAVSAHYRLPLLNIWAPIVKFLISHLERVTDMIPVEIGEIAEMWARMEDYTSWKWSELAELAILNAEKEFRREVAGEYRRDSSSRFSGGNNNARKTIYLGALCAATQSVARTIKLVSKAAGIAPWEDGDTGPKTRESWLGKWNQTRHGYSGDTYVEMPPTSWPGGPTRTNSRDFFHAWFESTASVRLFKKSPLVACDVTLGFLIEWPKRKIFQKGHHGTSIDQYGFTFEADNMYPEFYTKGPFLHYLRWNWEPALKNIVQLTNFATERYADWWCYDDSKPSLLMFRTTNGEATWLGNHQVYGWSRFSMNTVHVVSCALMALEKWLEEQTEKKESIALPVQCLYKEGRSQAFAGLLIALGKRHPELFLDELKPLLFLRDIYIHDIQIVRDAAGIGYWPHDGEFMNKIRREWDSLPGRNTGLKDLTQFWFVTRPEIRQALEEVAVAWRSEASALPEKSDDRLPLLRWSAMFDLSNYKKATFPDGSTGWQYELPEELQDAEANSVFNRRKTLLELPYQCSDMLEKRPILSQKQLNYIWEQLHNWTGFEQSTEQTDNGDEFASSFRDHRHARAGLITVLFCLGGAWLNDDAQRRSWLEAELQQLLSDPPDSRPFGADDLQDGYESFLARSAVQCWIQSPDNEKWREVVGNFTAAYRYRTIQRLFEEAFRERAKLPNAFRELEALALSFAVIRRKAKLEGFKPRIKLISNWIKKWVPKFAKGRGPKWAEEWRLVEIEEPFPPAYIPLQGMTDLKEQRRRNYGLDMSVLLAAFGALPPLADAKDADEREHWFCVCREMLAAYIRTFPIGGNIKDNEKWPREIWKVDEKVLEIVAARIFQCTPEEQRSLWIPILDLPPVGHHHIELFLSNVLIETIRSDPPRVTELIPIWRAMIEYLLASPKWTGNLKHDDGDVWKTLFLYGGSTSVKDKDHMPLVSALRDLFELHIKTIEQSPHDQSAFAAFVLSDAGEQLLVETFVWLNQDWQQADSYFWERIVERGIFEDLLKRAWLKYFSNIRERPEALKAFKTLTLNLASQQVATAIEIQKQIAGV